jgi:hypothetical protein
MWLGNKTRISDLAAHNPDKHRDDLKAIMDRYKV